MNILYIGVKNPVSFAAEHLTCREVTLLVENGSATKTGACDYDVRVTKPGKARIFLVKGKDTLYRSLYRVKYIPDPVTTWGNNVTNYPLDSLRAQDSLQATMQYVDFDDGFSIVSFEMTVLRRKQLGDKATVYCDACLEKIEKEPYEVIFSGTNKGSAFQDTLKSFIRNKLRPGDKVFIESIKGLGPDGLIRHLNSIAFTVQ